MSERSSEEKRTVDDAGQRPPVTPNVGWQVEEDEISLLQLFSVLLRRRSTIIRATIAVSFIAFLVALFSAKNYTASTSFIPQGSESQLSGLAGLAGQFGFQLPSENASQSPEFYAELVTSREILGTIAVEEFEFEEVRDDEVIPVGGPLADLLEIADDEEDPAVRRHATIKWLREEGVSVTTDRETGLVEVSVETPWAGLSYRLVERLMELVNEFNLQTRQSQAAAEREFVEERLAEVQDSLLAAENRQEDFLEANRQWANSPELTFQHDRLARKVLMQQQVYTGLAEAYEQARIAEVRNTPVITLVDAPELPAKADPRRRVLKLALGIVLGGMLGVFLAFGQEYLTRARNEEEEEYQEFSTLWAQTWQDIKTFGGVFGRKRG